VLPIVLDGLAATGCGAARLGLDWALCVIFPSVGCCTLQERAVVELSVGMEKELLTPHCIHTRSPKQQLSG
jgi:hypothetical protein